MKTLLRSSTKQTTIRMFFPRNFTWKSAFLGIFKLKFKQKLRAFVEQHGWRRRKETKFPSTQGRIFHSTCLWLKVEIIQKCIRKEEWRLRSDSKRGRNAEFLNKYFYSFIKFSFQQLELRLLVPEDENCTLEGSPLIKSVPGHNLNRKQAEVSHRMKIRLFVFAWAHFFPIEL